MQTTMPINFAFSKWSKAFIVFTVATWFALGFNIPVLRQVLGFFYISFVPGLIILRSLKTKQIRLPQIILFSVGLSLASVMFIGLLLNWILPLVGISRPLTTFNVVLAVSILEFVLFLRGRLNISTNSILEQMKFGLNKSLLFIVSIPILSILGAILVRSGNTSLLLFTFVMISALFLLITFGKINARLYTFAIWAIAIALLFQTTLVSRYLNGWDIHFEYYVAKVTEINQYWNSAFMSTLVGPNNYNTMLSITILPTVYSTVLNLDLFYVYTIIYPLVFSIVPLALYLIYDAQLGSRVAFWSVFFFMSLSTFYITMTYLARQMIAELFFVLLFLLLFEKGKGSSSRTSGAMMIIFAAALIVSHYSLSFLGIFYLLFFSLAFIRESSIRSSRLYVVLFASIAFSWYIFVSNETPLISLASLGKSVIVGSLQELFSAETRDPIILSILGEGQLSSLVVIIGRMVFLTTTVLIAVGFLKSLLLRKEMKFSKAYFAASFAGALIIFASVVLPYFSGGLTISRTYQIGLFFTAPFLVVGSEFLFQCVSKLKRSIFKTRWSGFSRTNLIGSVLLSSLLITYFLFQGGVVYELVGATPTSLSLTIDKERILRGGNIGLYDAFTFEEEVYSARWLLDHAIIGHTSEGSKLFSDGIAAKQVLASYGMINRANIAVLSNNSLVVANSCIYLRSLNVVYGIFEDDSGKPRNSTEFSKILTWTDKIYSNGRSEVLWSPIDLVP